MLAARDPGCGGGSGGGGDMACECCTSAVLEGRDATRASERMLTHAHMRDKTSLNHFISISNLCLPLWQLRDIYFDGQRIWRARRASIVDSEFLLLHYPDLQKELLIDKTNRLTSLQDFSRALTFCLRSKQRTGNYFNEERPKGRRRSLVAFHAPCMYACEYMELDLVPMPVSLMILSPCLCGEWRVGQ